MSSTSEKSQDLRAKNLKTAFNNIEESRTGSHSQSAKPHKVASMREFTQNLRTKFYKIIDTHIHRMEQIFSAFKFKSIQMHLDNMHANHLSYAVKHEEELQKILNMKIQEKLEFKDDSYLEYEKISALFDRNLKGGKRQPVISNLITTQRLLNLLDLANPYLLDPPYKNYDLRDKPVERSASERINLFDFNQHHDTFYVFCSNNKGYLYDSGYNPSDIKNVPCSGMTTIRVWKDHTALGNKRGDVFVSDQHDLQVKYRFHFSAMIKNINFSDETFDNLFVTLARNKSLHFRRHDLIEWKKEFYNCNVLGYWPSIKKGVTYFNNQVKIAEYRDGAFRTKKTFPMGFVCMVFLFFLTLAWVYLPRLLSFFDSTTGDLSSPYTTPIRYSS